MNDTVSVQILQINIQAHTSTEIHICIHIYDIYSHIYKHVYNLHIFKFTPTRAREMSAKSLRSQGGKTFFIPLKLKNYKEACQREVAPLIY